MEKEWLLTRTKLSRKRFSTFILIIEKHLKIATKINTIKIKRSIRIVMMAFILVHLKDNKSIIIIFINNWQNEKSLTTLPLFENKIEFFTNKLNVLSKDFDNFLIHQKIESLVLDKKKLRFKLQQDEDLKRRILEMSVLYETSNELSNKFNGTEIINTTTESLAKVFDFEVREIAVLYFSNSPEIHIHSENNISKQHLISIKEGMLLAIKPFNDANFDSNKIKTKLNIANNEKINSDSKINTFAMIPLIFKNETIGMLTIYKVNATKPAINEMKFLQTLTNLLSTNLGKLDTLKKVETTKINSLVRSIDDGLILIDGENNITYTNPATKENLIP